MLTHTDTEMPCRPNPEPWFETRNKRVQQWAKDRCLECPMMLRCLADALEFEEMTGEQLHGIHGGLDPQERRKTKLKRIA